MSDHQPADVTIVGDSGDEGADVVGTRAGIRWLFQAKFRGSGGCDAAGAKDRAADEYKLFLAKKPDYPEKEKLQKYIADNSKTEN